MEAEEIRQKVNFDTVTYLYPSADISETALSSGKVINPHTISYMGSWEAHIMNKVFCIL